jgi:hypothetical protein
VRAALRILGQATGAVGAILFIVFLIVLAAPWVIRFGNWYVQWVLQ